MSTARRSGFVHSLRKWLSATRPRTLLASVAPVAVGSVVGAGSAHNVAWKPALACLVGAVLIQIGTNFANDAFDALKGADTSARLGPPRAVASGLVTPRAMLLATALVLGLAFIVGLFLTSIGGWPILVLGLVSMVCAVAYTGGPYPLAYHGLGDVFVFIFFGLAAVVGSAWMQAAEAFRINGTPLNVAWLWHAFRGDPHGWLIAGAMGFQATAIIAINNLRDRDTDAAAGKRTLAVRLRESEARWYHAALHAGAAVCLMVLYRRTFEAWDLLPLGTALIGGGALSILVFCLKGRALNACLGLAALNELITAAALVGVRW